jgi:membrane-bound lytic murein transglycosylase B
MRAVPVLALLPLLAAFSGCGSSPTRPGAGGAEQPVPETALASADVPPARPRPRPAPPASRPAPGGAPLTGDYAGYPAVEALIGRLEREHGFERAYLNGVLSRVERQQWILDYMSRPSPPPAKGPTGSWTRYRARFLGEDRIDRGVRFWREHADVLDRAYRRYGVPPEYVVAIVGVETHYGANTGRHRVIDALATLAFDYPRRSEFFTGELQSFLVMARNEGFDPFAPVGSYAGAMGLGQFMPSSFLRYAVDFDGDGRRDLWNPVDAIGSVANYFSEHGWRHAQPVVIPALARSEAAHLLEAGLTTSYRPERLAEHGVSPRVPLDGQGEVSLLRLDGAGGYEYWLGLPNFYVITRYNQSTYYAMSVHQLAQAVHARREREERTLLSRAEAPAPG